MKKPDRKSITSLKTYLCAAFCALTALLAFCNAPKKDRVEQTKQDWTVQQELPPDTFVQQARASVDTVVIRQQLVNTVRDLFAAQTNKDVQAYAIDTPAIIFGSFTAPGSIEALVSVYDHNQCHASGWGELWLCAFDNLWRLDKKIGDADWAIADTADMNGDGVLELWVREGGMNQGYVRESRTLERFTARDSVVVLFTISLEYREGDELLWDDVFFDADGDNRPELLCVNSDSNATALKALHLDRNKLSFTTLSSKQLLRPLMGSLSKKEDSDAVLAATAFSDCMHCADSMNEAGNKIEAFERYRACAGYGSGREEFVSVNASLARSSNELNDTIDVVRYCSRLLRAAPDNTVGKDLLQKLFENSRL
jgi:hypothetical protein